MTENNRKCPKQNPLWIEGFGFPGEHRILDTARTVRDYLHDLILQAASACRILKVASFRAMLKVLNFNEMLRLIARFILFVSKMF